MCKILQTNNKNQKKKKKETRNKKKHNHTKEECQELMWPQRENFTKQLGKLQ